MTGINYELNTHKVRDIKNTLYLSNLFLSLIYIKCSKTRKNLIKKVYRRQNIINIKSTF